MVLISSRTAKMLHVTKSLKYEHIKEPVFNALHAASVRGRTWTRLRVTSLKEPSCMVQYVHTHKMVNLCVAPGCSNTLRDRVSLHKFPSDPKLREKRVKQDRRTRDRAQWTATKLPVLCSRASTSPRIPFEVDSAITATFGIPKKRRLKPDAVPTIVTVLHNIIY